MLREKKLTNDTSIVPGSVTITGVSWEVNTKVTFDGTAIISDLYSAVLNTKSFEYDFGRDEVVFVRVTTHLSGNADLVSDIIAVGADTIHDGTYNLSYAPKITIEHLEYGNIKVMYADAEFYDRSVVLDTTSLRICTLSHRPIYELKHVKFLNNEFIINKEDYKGHNAFIIELENTYVNGEISLIGREMVIVTNDIVPASLDSDTVDHSRTSIIRVSSNNFAVADARINGTLLFTEHNRIYIPDNVYGKKLSLSVISNLFGRHYIDMDLRHVNQKMTMNNPAIVSGYMPALSPSIYNISIITDEYLFYIDGMLLHCVEKNTLDIVASTSLGVVMDDIFMLPINNNTISIVGYLTNKPIIITLVLEDNDTRLIILDTKRVDREIKVNPYMVDGYYIIGNEKYNPFNKRTKSVNLLNVGINIGKYNVNDNQTVSNFDSPNTYTYPTGYFVKNGYETSDGVILYYKIMHVDPITGQIIITAKGLDKIDYDTFTRTNLIESSDLTKTFFINYNEIKHGA